MYPEDPSEPRGFTLVELMIVVAILAILAAIAGVAYSKWIDEAKRVEAKQFLSTIRGKEESYRARYGTYIAASANPVALPTASGKEPWVAANAQWALLGARPGADSVSYRYTIVAGTGTCAEGTFTNACSGIPDPSATWFFAVGANTEERFYVNSAHEAPFAGP